MPSIEPPIAAAAKTAKGWSCRPARQPRPVRCGEIVDRFSCAPARNRRNSATRSFGLSPWTVWPARGTVTNLPSGRRSASRMPSSSWNTSLSAPRTTRVGQVDALQAVGELGALGAVRLLSEPLEAPRVVFPFPGAVGLLPQRMHQAAAQDLRVAARVELQRLLDDRLDRDAPLHLVDEVADAARSRPPHLRAGIDDDEVAQPLGMGVAKASELIAPSDMPARMNLSSPRWSTKPLVSASWAPTE